MHNATCRACSRSFPVQHRSSRPESFLCRDCKTLAALATAYAVSPGAFDSSAEALAREIVADVLQGGNVDRVQWAQWFDSDPLPDDPIALLILGDDEDDEPTATVRVFTGLVIGTAAALKYLQTWRGKAENPRAYAIRDAVVQSFIERDRESVWYGVLGTEVVLWIPERLYGRK